MPPFQASWASLESSSVNLLAMCRFSIPSIDGNLWLTASFYSGVSCSPITVVGLGGTQCSNQVVCCDDNNFVSNSDIQINSTLTSFRTDLFLSAAPPSTSASKAGENRSALTIFRKCTRLLNSSIGKTILLDSSKCANDYHVSDLYSLTAAISFEHFKSNFHLVGQSFCHI